MLPAVHSTLSLVEEIMIYVVATIELAEGMRDAFLDVQRDLLPLVRAEAGCIEYVPTVDVPLADPAKTPPRPNCVVMQEKWEIAAALAGPSDGRRT